MVTLMASAPFWGRLPGAAEAAIFAAMSGLLFSTLAHLARHVYMNPLPAPDADSYVAGDNQLPNEHAALK